MKPHFPIALSGPLARSKINSIDVEQSKATVPADKELVLSRIINKRAYNHAVRAALHKAPHSPMMVVITMVMMSLISCFILLMIWAAVDNSDDDCHGPLELNKSDSSAEKLSWELKVKGLILSRTVLSSSGPDTSRRQWWQRRQVPTWPLVIALVPLK